MQRFTKVLFTLCVVLGMTFPGSAMAQESPEEPVAVPSRLFMPLMTSDAASSSAEEGDLVASYLISVGEDDQPVITLASGQDMVNGADAVPLLQVVISEEMGGTEDEVGAAGITCPWGGTGSTRIGRGWLSNPAPDLDFYVDYKLPKRYREATVCVTSILWAALKATGKSLDVRFYSYTSSYYRVRIVIGSTAVRNFCIRYIGSPNCGNAILDKQATLRYRS